MHPRLPLLREHPISCIFRISMFGRCRQRRRAMVV
ncbi:hypothetical protein IL54_3456 [Sphingobium sp. ba1]|nr:hypothetical protein IL54_3456 [Sphingobium sp. ba1]